MSALSACQVYEPKRLSHIDWLIDTNLIFLLSNTQEDCNTVNPI